MPPYTCVPDLCLDIFFLILLRDGASCITNLYEYSCLKMGELTKFNVSHRASNPFIKHAKLHVLVVNLIHVCKVFEYL